MALGGELDTYLVENVAQYERIAEAIKKPSGWDTVKMVGKAVWRAAPKYTILLNAIRTAINFFAMNTLSMPDFNDPLFWARETVENTALIGMETAPKIGELAINSKNPKMRWGGLGLTIAGKILFPLYTFGLGANYSSPDNVQGDTWLTYMNLSTKAFAYTTTGNVYMTVEAINEKNPGLLLAPLVSAPYYLNLFRNTFGVTGTDPLRFGNISPEVAAKLYGTGAIYLLDGSIAAGSVEKFTDGKVRQGAQTAKGALSLAAAIDIVAWNLADFISKVGIAASYEESANTLRKQQEKLDPTSPEWQQLQDQIDAIYEAYGPIREDLIEDLICSAMAGTGAAGNYKTFDQMYQFVRKKVGKVEEVDIQNLKQVGPNTVLLTPVEGKDKKSEHDSLVTDLSMVDICEAWDLLYNESKRIKDAVAGKDLYLNINVAFKDQETEEEFNNFCEDVDKLLKPHALYAKLNASAARPRIIVTEEDRDADILADYGIWCAGYVTEAGTSAGSSRSRLCKLKDNDLISGFMTAIDSFAKEAADGDVEQLVISGVTYKKYSIENLKLTPTVWYAAKAEDIGLIEILLEEMAKDGKEKMRELGELNGDVQPFEGMPLESMKKAVSRYKIHLEFCEFFEGVLAPGPDSIKNGGMKAIRLVGEQIERIKNGEPDEARRAYDQYRGIEIKEPVKKFASYEVKIPIEELDKIGKENIESRIASILEPEKLMRRKGKHGKLEDYTPRLGSKKYKSHAGTQKIDPEAQKIMNDMDDIDYEFKGIFGRYEDMLRQGSDEKSDSNLEKLKESRTQLEELKGKYNQLREKLWNDYGMGIDPLFEIPSIPTHDSKPLLQKPVELPELPTEKKVKKAQEDDKPAEGAYKDMSKALK